jgi:folate-binding protein YgfZ
VTLDPTDGPIRVARIDRAMGAGYDLWLAPSTAPTVLAALTAARATPCGADALETLRVFARRADTPAEFGEHASPLELDAFDGLTDGKGCYPGQEVIERTLSLGTPPRKLVALALDGETTPGASITDGDRTVGTVTSAARLPDGEWVALALIKRRSADAGPWTCGDATARRR